MKPEKPRSASFIHLAAAVSASVLVACSGNVPLGQQSKTGGAPGTGGVLGTGGGAGGGKADAAPGTGGGSGGAGGTSVADAALGSGGLVGQTGGQVGTGGAVGSGGKLGTGGASGVGGSTSTATRCGTIAGLTCPAGQFCDLASNCGLISDAAGVCMPTGATVGCLAYEDPVCGCDGKTYSNDCMRIVQGVLKAADGACPGGTGGRTSTGGSSGTGGKIGTGGSPIVGGASGSGGKTGTGGATGQGGATSTGGSTGGTCGGTAAVTCPAGQFCDLASDCGRIANATGVCAATGAVVCPAIYGPVCGCDGKWYDGGDCGRRGAGMLKASDDTTCRRDGGAPTYPSAYLAWQAPGGGAGTGPAVVVSGAGWADTWNNTPGFSPETPPSSATGTYTLTSAQTDDLFARLVAVNLSSLPHPTTLGYECYPRLYFRLCASCATTTLDYDVPQQLGPEMDPVWLWFDQLLGSGTGTNPRTYCNWDL